MGKAESVVERERSSSVGLSGLSHWHIGRAFFGTRAVRRRVSEQTGVESSIDATARHHFYALWTPTSNVCAWSFPVQCRLDLCIYIYIPPGNLQMHDLHPSFEAEWRGMRSSKGISWRLVLVLGVLYVLLRSSLPLAKCIRCIRQSCQIWYYNIITLRKTLSALSTLSALVIRSHRHQISS